MKNNQRKNSLPLLDEVCAEDCSFYDPSIGVCNYKIFESKYNRAGYCKSKQHYSSLMVSVIAISRIRLDGA